ncbi:LysE family translocator [Kangsaoukella pontilimi]|uniref:LysE family translocator n=1 Tax=Kangsaoukella pontilimi TaxID=2691042 RepID=UPI00136D9BFA|nr:LysE family translocator [Kangsaoukella pontilimi]
MLLAFVNVAFVASITPGPNNLMVAASGAAFGIRATAPHIAGIALGFSVMLSSVAFGLGAVLDRWPLLLVVLKWAGIAWLCVLAWQLARPALFPEKAAEDTLGRSSGARPMTLIEAALFQWVNPKAWAMVAAVTAAYSNLADQAWHRAALMSLTFVIIAPLCNGAWLLGGRVLLARFSAGIWSRGLLLFLSGLILLSAGLILSG